MKAFFLLVFILSFHILFSQNDRYNDFNNVNWGQVFVTKKISAKTDWLVEYQWRRTNGLKSWQQGLFRTAIQYKPSVAVSLAAGYAQAETFAYGDFPIANNGTFPEHRLFEQVVLKQELRKTTVSHRFRIEQRFVGRVKAGTDREIEDWVYSNRFRYLLKIQHAFTPKLYAWCGDEIFIGAGKNVGVNIFDQNRIFLQMGAKLSKNLSVEAGYFNQTLQQGRRINNQTIMQRNNGFNVASFLTL